MKWKAQKQKKISTFEFARDSRDVMIHGNGKTISVSVNNLTDTSYQLLFQD